VENRLRDALRQDRARVQFGTISKFGLMEMSRQRLKPALSEGSSIPCPRCGGSGHIRDTESSALQILRIIQEESMKDNTAAVHCQVPVEVASFLLNEKRTEIAKIELKQRVAVLMVPNKTLETPNYRLERLKHDDPRLDHIEASYKLAEEVEDPTAVTRRSQEPTNKQTPVIKGVLPDAPAPQAVPRTEPQAEARAARAPQRPAAAPQQPAARPPAPQEQGFFSWLKSLFGMGDTPVPVPAPAPAPAAAEAPAREPRRDGRGGEGRGRRGERSGSSRDANGRDGAAEGRGRRSERPSDARPTEGGARPPREGREGRDGRDGGRGRQGGTEARSASEAQTATAAVQGLEAADGDNRNEARSERAPRNGNGRRERQPRGEGRERQPRNQNQPASNAPADFVDTAPLASLPDLDLSGNDMPAAPAQGEAGETRTRRSRDRYGRDRQRGERAEQRRDAQDTPAAEGTMMDFELPGQPAPAEAAAPDNSRRSYFAPAAAAAPTAPAAEPAPVAPSPVPTAAAPAPAMAAPVAATPAPVAPAAPVAAPAAATNGALPAVTAFVLPVDEMQQVAQSSGLQWVQSDADKVAAIQAAIAAEPRPIHIPRVRPPVVVLDEGPLVLVETRRDLRDMQLPFDQPPTA
ncbi:MAG: ribonuclease E/G, partial [Burkholderiaceae bacterium]|nr:ribonuclease E/G [Burkholderiaceae bacterium]